LKRAIHTTFRIVAALAPRSAASDIAILQKSPGELGAKKSRALALLQLVSTRLSLIGGLFRA
jgi:hypothetical protein